MIGHSSTLDGFFAECTWNTDGLASDHFADKANAAHLEIANGDYDSLAVEAWFIAPRRDPQVFYHLQAAIGC